MRFESAFERHSRIEFQIEGLEKSALSFLLGFGRFGRARANQSQFAFKPELLG